MRQQLDAAAKTIKRATHKNAAQLGAPTTQIWIRIRLKGCNKYL
jgi:hypothetical protein